VGTVVVSGGGGAEDVQTLTLSIDVDKAATKWVLDPAQIRVARDDVAKRPA